VDDGGELTDKVEVNLPTDRWLPDHGLSPDHEWDREAEYAKSLELLGDSGSLEEDSGGIVALHQTDTIDIQAPSTHGAIGLTRQ